MEVRYLCSVCRGKCICVCVCMYVHIGRCTVWISFLLRSFILDVFKVTTSSFNKGITKITVKYGILGEGNGIPLQYTCLENPMDGGAW